MVRRGGINGNIPQGTGTVVDHPSLRQIDQPCNQWLEGARSSRDWVLLDMALRALRATSGGEVDDGVAVAKATGVFRVEVLEEEDGKIGWRTSGRDGMDPSQGSSQQAAGSLSRETRLAGSGEVQSRARRRRCLMPPIRSFVSPGAAALS